MESTGDEKLDELLKKGNPAFRDSFLKELTYIRSCYTQPLSASDLMIFYHCHGSAWNDAANYYNSFGRR